MSIIKLTLEPLHACLYTVRTQCMYIKCAYTHIVQVVVRLWESCTSTLGTKAIMGVVCKLLAYYYSSWPSHIKVLGGSPPPPPPPHTHTHTMYIIYTWVSLSILIGGTVRSSTEHKQDRCFFELCCSLID